MIRRNVETEDHSIPKSSNDSLQEIKMINGFEYKVSVL